MIEIITSEIALKYKEVAARQICYLSVSPLVTIESPKTHSLRRN